MKEFNGSKLQTAIFVKPQDKKKKKDIKPIWIIYQRRLLFSVSEKIIFLMYFCPNPNLDLKSASNFRKKIAIRNCPDLLFM